MNRSFCVLILLATSLVLRAQKNDVEVKIRLNHLAVYVHDLKSSTAFYDSVLNLKKIEEPFKDGLHTWYSLGDAGQLHLIQGAEKNVPRNKNDHLCFSVPSVDVFLGRLKRFNVQYSNWPGEVNQVTTRVDGIKQIYFQDPDGHWIEINNDFGKKAK